MEQMNIQTYRYRWVILLVFSLTMAIQQLLWITFASITTDAMNFYGVSDLSIGMLSMVFMIVYIFISIPCSWLIDTYGFKVAVGLGAILTGVFGLLRGLFPNDFTWVLIFQIGISFGQPLILNAVTKVASRWFPMKERATASGLSWLAGYLGLIVGLALTPYLTQEYGIPKMLNFYGIFSTIVAILFIIFAKEKPLTPQCTPEEEERSLVFDGLKHMMSKKQYILLAFIFFIGLGIFNGLSTWIEQVLGPRGFTSTDAGYIGGMMVLCGIAGSGILPMLSDKFKNRSKFLLASMAGAVPGLIGITFAHNFVVVLLSAGLLGFFMLSAAPIGFQYGSELAYPAPEGTSTGILMMMGQISGIIFIFGMDLLKSPKDNSMTLSMILLIALLVLCAALCIRLKEPKVLLDHKE